MPPDPLLALSFALHYSYRKPRFENLHQWLPCLRQPELNKTNQKAKAGPLAGGLPVLFYLSSFHVSCTEVGAEDTRQTRPLAPLRTFSSDLLVLPG